MAARTFADGVHQEKRIFLFDPTAGGAVRQGKRIFLFDAGGTARLIFSGADNLSMVVGSGGAGGSNGYINGGFGSLTPNTLGDGSVVQELAVGGRTSASPNQLVFEIRGYPGTIVSGYLRSLSVNGVVSAPGDANFTSFSGGTAGSTAQWIWQNAGIPTSGATIPIIVTRT